MKNIAIYKAAVDNLELEEIKKVLNEGNEDLSKVIELEENISSYIGCKYAIALVNTTAAINLSLRAFDIKRGDKIIMSVNSFVNIPQTVRRYDAEPIFVDINKDNMNIDLDKLEEVLKNNTSKKLRGAIITYVGNELPDLNRLYSLVKKYNIFLIEDCKSMLGFSYNGKKMGNLGADVSIFSTNHSVSKYAIGRSGVIATNNQVFMEKTKLLRTHALTTTYDSYGNLDYVYDVKDIGLKYDLSELDAAYALVQLRKIDTFIKKRQEIAKHYERRLANIEYIQVPKYNDDYVFTQYIIKVDKKRDRLASALAKRGISTALNYIPLHLLTYYKSKYGYKITDFPEALNNYQYILSLPIYAALNTEDIDYICDQIIEIVDSWFKN